VNSEAEDILSVLTCSPASINMKYRSILKNAPTAESLETGVTHEAVGFLLKSEKKMAACFTGNFANEHIFSVKLSNKHEHNHRHIVRTVWIATVNKS